MLPPFSELIIPVGATRQWGATRAAAGARGASGGSGATGGRGRWRASGGRPSPAPRASASARVIAARISWCSARVSCSSPGTETRSTWKSASQRNSASISALKIGLPLIRAISLWKKPSSMRKRGGIVGGKRLFCKDFRQALEVGDRAAAGGDPGHLALDGGARLLEVLERRRRVGEQVLHRLADLVDHAPDRGLRDPRAPAMADLDEPDRLQRLHRLADRRAADAELLHELALGRQRLPQADGAALDQLEQPAAHLIGKLLSTDHGSNTSYVLAKRQDAGKHPRRPGRWLEGPPRRPLTRGHRRRFPVGFL